MQWVELKHLLGSRYRYNKWMSEGEVERLKREAPADFSDLTAASLTAECVRIDAVLFQAGGQLRLGYDVFVKWVQRWAVCPGRKGPPFSLTPATSTA